MAAVVGDGSALARELADLREQQRAVSGVLRALAEAAGLQPVLDEVTEACSRLCSADNGALWLLEDGLLHSAAHGGTWDGAAFDKENPHTVDRGTIAGRTALVRGPVNVPDILADAEYTYSGPVQYRSMLGVPIMVEDDLIGVIVVVRKDARPFTEEHVDLAQTFADQAAIAIRHARLVEAVHRQRSELSRFVSPQVAALISSAEGEQLLAGHRAYISVLFCDLRGFTAFAETAAPEDLFEVLRDYHGALGALIAAHRGTLEHFAGDGVMVFFNDPVPVDGHEVEAIRFALEAQRSFAQVAGTWQKRGAELGLGIGIEAGYATLGRIGFEGRYDYGAIGPVTNLAARLSDRATPGQILVGPRAFATVEDAVDGAAVGELDLKGFARPVSAYEVSGLRT